MDEVTGRDKQIICQALKIALAIMQNHSDSKSNIEDMEQILLHLSQGARVEFPDKKIEEFVHSFREQETSSPTKFTDVLSSIPHELRSESRSDDFKQSIERLTLQFSAVDKENLDFILFALHQTHAAIAYEFKKNECRRNLNIALHQYWQNKEMGLHSTSQRHKIPMSMQAKSTNEKTQVEHVVPLKVIVDLLLDLEQPTKETVGTLLSNFYRVCLVTVEEHKRLTDAGLRSKMPDDWDGKDPYARYRVVGIECDPSVTSNSLQ